MPDYGRFWRTVEFHGAGMKPFSATAFRVMLGRLKIFQAYANDSGQ